MKRLVQNTRILLKILAVVAILAVANVVATQWDLKWDLSASGLYSLTNQSQEIVRNLDAETELIYFHTDQAEARSGVKPLWIRTLLENYAGKSEQVEFREVDLNLNPSRAEKYQVRQNNSVVVRVGESHKTLSPRDLLNIQRRGSSSFNGEKAITNALQNQTTVTDRTVWFTTGHGEIQPSNSGNRTAARFQQLVQEEGFNARTLDPLSDDFPDTRDLVVMIDPGQSLAEGVRGRITQWYQEGGRLLVATSPSNRNAINPLTESLGVTVEPQQILGTNWEFFYRTQGNPFLLAPELGDHPVGGPLKDEGLSVLLGRTAPLSINNDGFTPLLSTSPQAHAKPLGSGNKGKLDPAYNPDTDDRGRFPVAVATAPDQNEGDTNKKRTPTGKLLVMSNADLFTNRYLRQAGNRDFASNAVNWFFERNISLGIEPTPLQSNVVENISPSQSYFLQIVSLLLVPFGVLIWGGVVWWKRRNL